MEQVDISETLSKSKEMKNLMKCAEKNCDRYAYILGQEKEVIDKMVEIKSSLNGPKNPETLIAKSLNLIKLTKELTKLNTEKDAIVCGLSKCGKEFANLYTLRHKKMIGLLDKKEKMLVNYMKQQKK